MKKSFPDLHSPISLDKVPLSVDIVLSITLVLTLIIC